MIAKYKNQTNVGIGGGIAMQIVSQVVLKGQQPTPALAFIALGLVVLGAALFIYGCWNYCLGKGYPGPLGLLGLLSCLGLVILVCLPDKRKDGQDPEVRGFDVMPSGPPPRNPQA